MRAYIKVLSAVAMLAVLIALFSRPKTVSEFDTISPSIVYITHEGKYGKSIGTGFYIDKNYIVTAAHVVENEGEIYDKSKDALRRVLVEEELDLAVVCSPTDAVTTLPLYPGNRYPVGSKVYTIGQPYAYEHTFSDGIVSAPIRIIGGAQHIQINASTLPGNSGGPVVNERLQVIGIVSKGLRGFSSMGFAIPVHTWRHKVLQAIEAHKKAGGC